VTLIIINRRNKEDLSLFKTLNITNSGKKDGRGGIEELISKKKPRYKGTMCKPISELNRDPKREKEDCLKIPPVKNIPIEAHP
jgi:hypothetical protein